MNDADWAFLQPWFEILKPMVFLPDAKLRLNGSDKDDDATLQPRVRYLGIDPFLLIITSVLRGGSPDVDQLSAIGRAMEIVALALRVEPRVWGLIRDCDDKPLLDMTAYDPQQLGAGLLVKCQGVEMIGQVYGALFLMGEGGMRAIGGWSSSYKKDRERLGKMFYSRCHVLLQQYQIPLAINIARSRGEVPISAMQTFFDAIAMTMNVETALPPRMMQAGWATYRLKDVYVEACDGTQSEMAQLKRAGVGISGATYAHFMSHEAVHAIVNSSATAQQLKAINIHVDSSDGVARLYSALSCGQHIGVLSVRLSATEDLTPLAHVLLLTHSKCTALHRLDIDTGHSRLDLQACEAVAATIDVASRGPRRNARLLKKVNAKGPKGAVLPLLESIQHDAKKQLVVLPDGNAIEVACDAVEAVDDTDTSEAVWTTAPPIETFSLTAKAADARAAMAIVKLMQRCLPQSLNDLTLRVDSLDDTCLALILASFPELKTLRIKDASITTVESLVDAYESHDCQIEALELGAYDLDVTGLLTALRNPRTRIATTLKQLQLNCPYDEEPREAFLLALKKMLRANQSLEFVKLCKVGQEDKAEVDEQLSEPRQARMATPRKQALISAIHAAASMEHGSVFRALGSLDCQVVNTVMAMAETPRFRVVCVE